MDNMPAKCIWIQFSIDFQMTANKFDERTRANDCLERFPAMEAKAFGEKYKIKWENIISINNNNRNIRTYFYCVHATKIQIVLGPQGKSIKHLCMKRESRQRKKRESDKKAMPLPKTKGQTQRLLSIAWKVHAIAQHGFKTSKRGD